MSQIFHPVANTIAKITIFGAVFIIALIIWLLVMFNRSSYVTQEKVVRGQPVPFSHKHHVTGLGMDCRYCHVGVDESAYAGIPSAQICMNCHSIIWKDSPILEPVRESYKTGKPIAWLRLNDLPDYVYFDHSIHVAKGVACVVCHGPVDQMPLTWREKPLHMRWCLGCHREPERYIREKDDVFRTDVLQEEHSLQAGKDLVKKYHVKNVTNCSACHR
ncbi:MAG: cytochrome c3 family protein [Chlamydiota bacterium]|nr:cytochrome c3 family protein [Chlamydiota bacterium]